MRLHSLGRATVSGLAARLMPVLSSLFVSWSLANFAGLSVLGQFAFAAVTMQVACGNATLGVDGSLFRLLIRRAHVRTPHQIARVMAASYATTGAIALALVVAALIAGLVLLQLGELLTGLFFLQLAPMPLGFSSVRTSIGALRVSGEITRAQWLDGVIPAILTVIAAIVSVAVNPAWLIYIPAVTALGWILNGVVARALVVRAYGQLPRSRQSLGTKLRLIKVSVPQQTVNIVNYITDWLPVLTIGILLSSRDMGIFRVVSQLALPLQLANTAVEFPSSTVIAKHFGAGELTLSQRSLANARFLMIAVTLPIALVIGASSPWMLPEVFNIDGWSAVWCLVALLLGQISNSIAGPVASTLASIGSSRILLKTSRAALACSVFCVPALGMAFGLMGICVGVAITWAVRAALNHHRVTRRLSSKPA